MALSQLSSFIAANTTLIAVAAFLLVALIYMEFRAVRFGVKKLTAQDAVAVMNQVGTLTIDIRPEEKFKQGTIRGAKHYPVKGELPQDLLKQLKKRSTKRVIVVCQKGISAVKAADLIKKSGMEEVAVLEGGIDQWHKDAMPLVQA